MVQGERLGEERVVNAEGGELGPTDSPKGVPMLEVISEDAKPARNTAMAASVDCGVRPLSAPAQPPAQARSLILDP